MGIKSGDYCQTCGPILARRKEVIAVFLAVIEVLGVLASAIYRLILVLLGLGSWVLPIFIFIDTQSDEPSINHATFTLLMLIFYGIQYLVSKLLGDE